MIELQNVTKLYGKVIGVNDITLSLSPGAYGLLGPNGSGKSTLLNLLTGQLKPTIGNLSVFGQRPRNNASLYRRIGYCPGSEGLYASVSALDWVCYLAQLHGMSRASAMDSARRCLTLVGLSEAMHRPIASYSRGMRQRTKLAQALAHEPEFLILDEPFNGLDPQVRHEMTELLHQWIDDGKSLLIASHVLFEVESITKSFLLISGGRLLASGTSEEVTELLTELPNEYTICTPQPYEMASVLMKHQVAESISIDNDRVVATTRNASEFVAGLPRWIADHGISVTELRSADESLQALFNSLMKMHRGEL